jgi:hypothetical protein
MFVDTPSHVHANGETPGTIEEILNHGPSNLLMLFEASFRDLPKGQLFGSSTHDDLGLFCYEARFAFTFHEPET